MQDGEIRIEPVEGKKGRAAFVDLGLRFASRLPHSVPQLRSEQLELVDPARNPFFGHATVQLFIAYRAQRAVGRISAHIDALALEIAPEQGMGPGTGMFGYFDAEDRAIATALLERAETWLREHGMRRALGPISLSVWEEPGLLVKGHDHAPMVMMGHHPPAYETWIEEHGFVPVKSLLTYELDVRQAFPRIVERIIQSGERNDRIRVRPIDKSDWDNEIAVVLGILNDAWSTNWGFIPFTPAEVAYAGKKLKPIVYPSLNRIAEVDGEPVAFMMTLPDLNDVFARIGGRLFPFGWFHLLRWLRRPRDANMRVPLMGVKKQLHNTRLASQLAFMMIGEIRRHALEDFGAKRAEIGWILDDNRGMVAIADAIDSHVNREYRIYKKTL